MHHLFPFHDVSNRCFLGGVRSAQNLGKEDFGTAQEK